MIWFSQLDEMKKGADVWLCEPFNLSDHSVQGNFMDAPFEKCMYHAKFVKINSWGGDDYKHELKVQVVDVLEPYFLDVKNVMCFDHKPTQREFDCMKLFICGLWLKGKMAYVYDNNGYLSETIADALLVMGQMKRAMAKLMEENVLKVKEQINSTEKGRQK